MEVDFLTPDFTGFQYTDSLKLLKIFSRSLSFCNTRINNERDFTVGLNKNHLDKFPGIDLMGKVFTA